MPFRNPYKFDSGYVTRRRNMLTGGSYVVYRAEQAGLDTAGGPWAVTCTRHNRLVNCQTLRSARSAMNAADFCEECERERKEFLSSD